MYYVLSQSTFLAKSQNAVKYLQFNHYEMKVASEYKIPSSSASVSPILTLSLNRFVGQYYGSQLISWMRERSHT